MILKIMNSDGNWEFFDDIRDAEIDVDNSVEEVSQDEDFMDSSFLQTNFPKCKTIMMNRKNDNYFHIHYNTEAYLLSDTGQTIEKI